jgi:hypothetical protein
MSPQPDIKVVKVTLDHVAITLQELKQDHKETQRIVMEMRERVASMNATSTEKSKLGDWVVAAVVSILTSLGVTGLAKAVIGSGAAHK